MYIVFFSTSDVFKAEERLTERNIDCKVVPTPVSDKAYCGVCLRVDKSMDTNCINDLEYELVEEKENV